MDPIRGATVTLPLQEFDELRAAAEEKEAEQLKKRIANCVIADFTEFEKKLTEIDHLPSYATDEEIDGIIAEATRLIEFEINKKAAISLFLDYAAYGKNGNYDRFIGEADADSLKKAKATFR